MSLDADVPVPSQASGRSAAQWLSRLRDRASVAGRDGARVARERTAMATSVARAQMERAQSFVAFHSQRRPLMVAGVAIGAGLLVGAAIASVATRRRT